MDRPPQPAYMTELVQFLAYKSDEDKAKAAAKELRDNLDNYVRTHGYEDERGNFFLELPKPIVVEDKIVKVLKAEKRVSLDFNEDRALELADAKGVRHRLEKTYTYVDQEEIYVLYQEDILSDEEVDSLFDKNYTWAFKTLAD